MEDPKFAARFRKKRRAEYAIAVAEGRIARKHKRADNGGLNQCSRCGGLGHNRQTCSAKRAA